MSIYNTATKRIAMRFIEIFVVAGVIGLLSSQEFQVLLPAGVIGIIAAVLKALREWRDEASEPVPINEPQTT